MMCTRRQSIVSFFPKIMINNSSVLIPFSQYHATIGGLMYYRNRFNFIRPSLYYWDLRDLNGCSWFHIFHETEKVPRFLIAWATIECFHMTSRRPYWCPKTMKRRPCWCPKPTLWELNSFLMQTLSFVPINLHRCWPREWKHSILTSRVMPNK